jgi:BolA protein
LLDYGERRLKNKERNFLTLSARIATLARMRVADSIERKLVAAFAPSLVEVTDESHRHAGHAGATRADGGQGETHFHVRMVTAAFDGVSCVERQRRVHAVLAEELRGPVHALSLRLQAPAEAAG